MPTKHQVWIELPDRDHTEHAELGTKMLHRLGYHECTKLEHIDGKGYILIFNQAGEFLELSDRGHWFNLDAMMKL